MTSRACACLLLMLSVALTGCQTPSGPDVVSVSAAQYDTAFNAAVEAARSRGMPAQLRDRRDGIIETEPTIASSIFEPWRSDNPTFSDAMENTLGMHRRIARFEFTPLGFESSILESPEVLTGPDMVGLGPADLDLTGYEGELELRVWVFLERAGRPGFQRNAWTRRRSGLFVAEDPDRQTLPNMIWTPVHRDHAFERVLLADVKEQLADANGSLAQASAQAPSQQ